MKLKDRFMISTDFDKWKIYDRDTRKKLCDDYGALRGDSELDEMSVWSIGVKTAKDGSRYLRVSVYKPKFR